MKRIFFFLCLILLVNSVRAEYQPYTMETRAEECTEGPAQRVDLIIANKNFIQIKQPEGEAFQLQRLITADEIQKSLEKVGRQLEEQYNGKELTIIMIMKGSFILVADLMRQLHFPARLDFIRCSSYANEKKGALIVEGVDNLEITGKHILVVDDIFDTGETLTRVVSEIEKKHPVSVRSLVLLCKNGPHLTDYRPDIALFDIEDRFVLGYGLDYNEFFRGLPDIYAIKR